VIVKKYSWLFIVDGQNWAIIAISVLSGNILNTGRLQEESQILLR
jgi:hypothetical protein